VRHPRELLRPNLFGLTDGELSPAALRLGRICVAATWAWLALGLALLLARALSLPDTGVFGAAAAFWLSLVFLLAALLALYLLGLLRDGWSRRDWRWRLPLAGATLLVTTMAIAGGGIWGRMLWLWSRT
jgi:hypothetical protein